MLDHRSDGATDPDGSFDQGRPPSLARTFATARPAFHTVLREANAYQDDLQRIRAGGRGLVGARPARFEQDWFPRLDAVAAYAMVRRARPRRILEVGCGHSTRFMAQAVVDGGLGTDVLCIDPRPRAPLDGLPVRHQARVLSSDDAGAVSTFEPGDILFIDSSHVAAPGTDVETVFLDLLPRLPEGALVHFHDVFLPDRYPPTWDGRRYNEQVAVAALLQGGGYDLLFASHYVTAHTDFLGGSFIEALPRPSGSFEGSLWLRKSGPLGSGDSAAASTT